jgi:hypothetical protein
MDQREVSSFRGSLGDLGWQGGEVDYGHGDYGMRRSDIRGQWNTQGIKD